MAQTFVVAVSYTLTAPDTAEADDVQAAVSEQLGKSDYVGMLPDGDTIDRDPGTLFIHATQILPQHRAAATG